MVLTISKQAWEGPAAQTACSSVSEPAAGCLFPTGAGIITLLSPLLFLFFRPDLRKRAQQKHLAEALRSEYASGLEAGSAKAKKQSKQAEADGELGEPSGASSSSSSSDV